MTPNDQQAHLRAERMALVAERLVGLADTLVDDFDVIELLDRLVADCVELLDVAAAGILLLNGDNVLDVVASSDEDSYLMEFFQLESHEGPCIEAVHTGKPVTITTAEQLTERWPTFVTAVNQDRFSAVYAFPMRLRSETIGALNLFNGPRSPMSEHDHRIAQALADVATIGILQQRSLSRTSLLSEQLQHALKSRITVEQAKGIVAEYRGVDVGAAFIAIRSYARGNGSRLSDVARALVVRDMSPQELFAVADPGH